MNAADVLLDEEVIQGATDDELVNLNRFALADDLGLYIREAWHVVEPATPFIDNWHIDAIADYLEGVRSGEIRRLLINIPPRTMKSLCTTVLWPTWVWITQPETRWIFVSYSSSLATKHSVDRRTVIQSRWYQQRWKTSFALAADQNLKTEFENTHRGAMVAAGIGGAISGKGGDFLVVDDPHDPLEAESDVQRQAAIDFFDLTLSTRLNDPKTGAIVVIMQRLHERDLSGHVLSSGGWEHLCLPMEAEQTERVVTPAKRVFVREPGALLWPERFGEEEVKSLKKSLGTYGASGQLQQRPAPAGGGIFKREWWKYYNATPRFSTILQSWDTAFKKTQTSDYSVCTTWGSADNGYYLLDVWRDRVEFPELKKQMVLLAAKWKPNEIIVEDKASGQSALQELRRDSTLPIVAVKSDTDKVLRAKAITPLIEASRVFIPVSAEWLADYLNELESFPVGAFDDQVDSTSHALNRLRLSVIPVAISAKRAPMQYRRVYGAM